MRRYPFFVFCNRFATGCLKNGLFQPAGSILKISVSTVYAPEALKTLSLGINYKKPG